MGSNSPPYRRKARSELVHLRSLLSVLPATSTGQVTAAWDKIEAGLARGMKLREVWEAAKLDGLQIPYPQFRVYVSRLRRRSQRSSTFAPQPPPTDKRRAWAASSATRSIQESARATGEKEKRRIEYDPFSINKNLID